MKNLEHSIETYIQQIHDLIICQRDYSDLGENRSISPQLMSASDAISDTELAIDAFIDKDFSNTKVGEKYLSLYGLLQALFVQQDASINLGKSLGKEDKLDNYPRLKEIREIRNDSIGHPSEKGPKKLRSYHQILYDTVTKSGFELFSNFSNGLSKRRYIGISEIIKDQRKFVSEILVALINILQEDERMHKEKFCTEKLADIFPPTTIDDFLAKIYEVVHGVCLPTIGIAALKEVRKPVQDFLEAIGRRYKNPHEQLACKYELVDHSINNLDKFFQARKNEEEPEIAEETARIFANFLKDQVHKLIENAKEIDCDYAS